MVDLLGYDNVEVAKERLKDAYRFSKNLGLGPLYVAFSGGKDSVCIYHLCHMAADELGVPQEEFADYHYHITNIDPPELVQFIKTFNDVHMENPPITFWRLVSDVHKMLPTRRVRFCCQKLKEVGGEGRFCVTGVRWAESTRRKNSRGAYEYYGASKEENRILNADNDEDRREMEHCIPKNKYMCNPIVDWKDDEVWGFIKKNNLAYCTLYDEGFKRLGCIGCPMASRTEREHEFARWPKYKDQYMRTIERMIGKRREAGLPLLNLMETPEKVFLWWMELAKDIDIPIFEKEKNT